MLLKQITQDQNLFVPAASVWATSKERAPRVPSEAPWLLQKLANVDGTVGVEPTRAIPEPARSRWGGWVDAEEYRRAYESHVSRGGYGPAIGAYVGPAEAVVFLRRAMSCPLPKGGVNCREPPAGVGAETQLIATSDELSACVWGRGSGSWLPSAGCLGRGTWPSTSKSLGQPHRVNIVSNVLLLPLVAKYRPPESDKDRAAVDSLMRDYLDAGVIVKWEPEMGFPTSVVNIHVVWQKDSNGKDKPRVIIDQRYPNSIVRAIPLVLPRVTDIARGLQRGQLVSKQDMKLGYHQLPMAEEYRHLISFVWCGCLMTFTVETFGWRDAPGAFQNHTAHVAHTIARSVDGIALSRVYLDDFIQVWKLGARTDVNRVLEQQVKHGVVLGSKKCEAPSTSCEVLGIVIDTAAMRLFVPPIKKKRYAECLSALLEEGMTSGQSSTSRVAGLLGRLVSVEPAMPHIMLLTRPLFDDLKAALLEANLIKRNTDLPPLESAKEAQQHYGWLDARCAISASSVGALTYLQEIWDEVDGQSIEQPSATLLLASDASDTGGGGRVFRSDGRDPRQQLVSSIPEFEFAMPLTMADAQQSSTYRETLVHEKLLLSVPSELLRGATVESISDNRGFVHRHWMGSICPEVSEVLIRIVKHLRAHNATWAGARWLPREHLSVEDELSRRERVPTESLQVNIEWYDRFLRDRRARKCAWPNVDAFATPENAVTVRHSRFVSANDGTPLRQDLSRTYVVAAPCEMHRVDGATQNWAADEVVWMFPPIALITRAVENWRASRSRVAYICVPSVSLSHHWLRALRELAPPRVAQDVVVEGAPDDGWKFCVYALLK